MTATLPKTGPNQGERMNRVYLSLCGAFLLAACGGSASADQAEISTACQGATNMGEEICDCVAEKAVEDLSEDGVAFLTAMLKGNDKKTEELRGQMPFDELTAAGLFMVSAPGDCAAENPGAN